MIAQPLSPAEARTVAAFDAAPPAEESYACTCGHEGLTAEWHADTCGTTYAPNDVVDARRYRALREAVEGLAEKLAHEAAVQQSAEYAWGMRHAIADLRAVVATVDAQ